MNIELIIFDCDGVLVDSELISSQVMSDIFKSIGINMSPQAVFDKLRGGSMNKTIAFAESKIGKLPVDIEKEYRLRSYEAYRKEMTPIPGITEVLSKLSIAKCVGSNGPQSKIKLNLQITGLDQFFDEKCIFSAYDVNKWKPDPSLYLYAAEKFDLPPEKCLVIEDSISGATAAYNAGMRCLGYARDTSPAEFEKVNASPIRDMKDIMVLYPEIFNI
jgi:HAD superfamily hydrolase (TIGR01509 family)